MSERFVTKPGRHGTLYLYAVTYEDRHEPVGRDTIRLWGYNLDHVEDRFYDESSDQEGDGWIIVSIARVLARVSQHRAIQHAPSRR